MSTPGPDLATTLPDGCYLSLSWLFRAGAGGQTRAAFGRNRLFAQLGGQRTTMLTLDSHPAYDEVRDHYRASGELVDGMRLLNIHEWFREDAGMLPTAPPGSPLFAIGPDEVGWSCLGRYRAHEVSHPNGVLHYRSYVDPDLQEMAREYLRPDGSVYLRAPAGGGSWVTPYVLVDDGGKPLGAWPRISGWYWAWLRALAADAERVFLLCDSRAALAAILPARDPRFHIVHQVHNAHLRGEGGWNSWVVPDYEPMFASIPRLDGLVLLSNRQREDVAQRYGETNNLFTVPNPVDPPDLPDPMPTRDRDTFVIVSRLDPQKNLADAIDVWALVVRRRPQARLLIYGEGRQRGRLQQRIDEHGLGDSVRLMGYDGGARERLLTATGFLMTSAYEGYPLATLESLSYGCPVVSYDIMYGPRDQVTDGEDGFLVPQRDVAGMAERVVQMVDDPALVARLGAGALRRARAHDHEAYVRRWAAVLRRVADQKAQRVDLRASLEVHELGRIAAEPGLLGRGLRRVRQRSSRLLPGRFAPPAATPDVSATSWAGSTPADIRLRATLRARGRIPRGALRRARVTLDAISPAGVVVGLPLRVARKARRFELLSEFGLDDALRGLPPGDRSVRLRLRLVVNNAAWDVAPARRPGSRSGYEVAFLEDDTLALRGDQRAPEPAGGR